MDKQLEKMFQQINILNDLIIHKNDIENSRLSKDLEALGKMLEMFGDPNFIHYMGPEDVLNTFVIVKQFGEELKPYYIKYCMMKGNKTEE